jgi:hypothetical protein
MTTCFLHTDKVLKDAQETFIVSDRRIPKDLPEGLKVVVNQKVCQECAAHLRNLGLIVFNLQVARDRAADKRRAGSMATIGQLLESQGVKIQPNKAEKGGKHDRNGIRQLA